MGFLAGSVSFSRFTVVGGAPKRLDAALAEKIAAHAIGQWRGARGDRVEAGWIGGGHILDVDFDPSRLVVGDALHFGLRIDAARVPPELMRAWYRMELDALAREKSDGRPSPRQRTAARDAARRRAEMEVREGRFRRMRRFPVLLDPAANCLLVGSSSPAVFEHLYPLFRETFGKRLELWSAGRLAYELAEARGRARAVEQAVPAAFVRHPDGNGNHVVYWTQHDPASREFLGNELLLWLWWRLEDEGGAIELPDRSEAAVVIVRSLLLECPWAMYGRETIFCDGPARLPEARRAIRAGKLPRRAGLLINRNNEQYELTLSAETFSVSGATLPKPADSNGDGPSFDPAERIAQVRRLCQTLDLLFDAFLRRRLGSGWRDDLSRMVRWLKQAE